MKLFRILGVLAWEWLGRKGSGSYVVEFPAMLSYNGRISCVRNMINVEWRTRLSYSAHRNFARVLGICCSWQALAWGLAPWKPGLRSSSQFIGQRVALPAICHLSCWSCTTFPSPSSFRKTCPTPWLAGTCKLSGTPLYTAFTNSMDVASFSTSLRDCKISSSLCFLCAMYSSILARPSSMTVPCAHIGQHVTPSRQKAESQDWSED